MNKQFTTCHLVAGIRQQSEVLQTHGWAQIYGGIKPWEPFPQIQARGVATLALVHSVPASQGASEIVEPEH